MQYEQYCYKLLFSHCLEKTTLGCNVNMPNHATFLSRYMPYVLKANALRHSKNLHILNPLCGTKNDLHNELHTHKKEGVQNKHTN